MLPQLVALDDPITPEHIEIELAFIEHWNCRVRRIMTAKDPRRAVRPLQPRGQSRSIFSVKTPWILGSTAVWSHRVPKIALGVLLVGFSVAAHTNQEPPPLRDVAGSTSHGGDAILIATGPTHPYKLTSVENGVSFDIDADGTPQQTAWTAPEDDSAFLAIDRNGNGTIDDGSELFGDHTLPGRGVQVSVGK